MLRTILQEYLQLQLPEIMISANSEFFEIFRENIKK